MMKKTVKKKIHENVATEILEPGQKTKKKLKKFFFCDSNGDLSTTKLMNMIFFVMAVSTFLIGVIAKLCCDKSLDPELYIYVGGLCGSSFLQYSYSKKLNGYDKK